MKNKIISKGLVIGSIILLISTTPLLVATRINENTQPSTLNDFGNNSLGTIRIVHIPLYMQWFKFHGIHFEYFPPKDNLGFDYYFCEIDGEVLMNFSLTVEHRINEIGKFFSDRFTWINALWIGDADVDYFRIEHKQPCVSLAFETYYVNMTEEDQIVPLLITNHKNVTLQFWLGGMPAVTTSKFIHTIMELLPGLPLNFLKSEGGHIEITIHPVQC
jgi:hypothetical protein